jgi:N-acetylglutamate synthase-like GNAT family acetyltransferase
MEVPDLIAVNALADRVHIAYPEDEAVFDNRLEVYAPGCFVYESEKDILAYFISHPWFWLKSPKLNSLLAAGSFADADVYYLHNLVVSEELRNFGVASEIVAQVLATAATQFARAALVAVNNSSRFWSTLGFENVGTEVSGLESYGSDAAYMMRNL